MEASANGSDEVSNEFLDRCPDSPDGLHKPVSLYPDPPRIGCLYCRKRNRLVKPTGQALYNLLVDNGVSAKEASRRSGWSRNTRKARKTDGAGSQGAKTATPAEVRG